MTNDSVVAFLQAIKDEQQREDSFAIKAMMEKSTGEPAKMWGASIIGFGTYHYVYESGREGDFMKTGFSPRAKNISLYLMTRFSKYETLLSQLGKHKTGKSCLYINKLSDVNLTILHKLIEHSYAKMTSTYG